MKQLIVLTDRKLVRSPNGFGSYEAEVAVIVKKPFEKFLHKSDPQYEVLSETNDSMTVLFRTKNRYAGDDETIVVSLWCEFPREIIEEGQFTIDWNNSGY